MEPSRRTLKSWWDEVAFRTLYRAHADAVFTFALRRLPASEAEDLVADVFLVAWRRRTEVPVDAGPWLLGVARRLLANRRRGQKRADALLARLTGEAIASGGGERRAGGDLDRPLIEALGSLSEADQELLLLAAWEGLAREGLASVLGISSGAVAGRLFRARRRLARALASREKDYGRGGRSAALEEVHDA